MTGQATPSPHGLCGSCVEAEKAGNKRGSRFILCRLSKTDPLYPKYPRLPVLRCAGYHADLETNPTEHPNSGAR